MKTFITIWSVVQLVLMLIGLTWVFIDRKNEKRKKAPYIIWTIGCVMMVIYFLCFR